MGVEAVRTWEGAGASVRGHGGGTGRRGSDHYRNTLHFSQQNQL